MFMKKDVYQRSTKHDKSQRTKGTSVPNKELVMAALVLLNETVLFVDVAIKLERGFSS